MSVKGEDFAGDGSLLEKVLSVWQEDCKRLVTSAEVCVHTKQRLMNDSFSASVCSGGCEEEGDRGRHDQQTQRPTDIYFSDMMLWSVSLPWWIRDHWDQQTIETDKHRTNRQPFP